LIKESSKSCRYNHFFIKGILMPIIESVSVAALAVPLDKVTSFSTRTVSERHYCLVKVRGKDGNEGIGFCYVGSAGGDIAKIAVEQLLALSLIHI
jgi:L-alanine-DL-glutamate epimerase-like enolase superfamily enzyme